MTDALSTARNVCLGVGLLTGKKAVVVGGTSGIGRAIAIKLAKMQCDVLIVGRSPKDCGRPVEDRDWATEVVEEMQMVSGKQSGYEFAPCDCFKLANVKACCETPFWSECCPDGIDFLVLTQGIATIQGFTPSVEEGLDAKLTLHYWSRVSFIRHLLPALKQKRGRVLSVLSGGKNDSYSSWSDDPELSKGNYSLSNAEDAAGMYNDIMVDCMSKDEPSVTFMHAAPGFVDTNWGTELPLPLKLPVRLAQAIAGRSMEEVGNYMCSGLLNPDHEGGYWILNEFGVSTGQLSPLHDEAKHGVWAHTKAVLHDGRSQSISKEANVEA